ncbi:MAG: phosphomannomutase/phosphoglucomutase, partial [Gemmatimonadota bacterium]
TVPTPVLYFAAHDLSSDGAVQVTGSHNPPEYNGLKLLAGPRSLYGPAIQAIRRRVDDSAFVEGAGSRSVDPNVLDRYVNEVSGKLTLRRPVSAVVDCGNGTASVVAVRLLERIGARVDPLYCESDGTFPNHHPDPTVDANLRDLVRRVRETRADVGIAFDGDGDRIGAVDELGTIVRGDVLLMVYAQDALRRGRAREVIFDVKCSQALEEVVTAHGGVPVMWKTGHSLIKEKMRETGARLAGEMSGHMFFADDYYGYDDALYAACRLLDVLARARRPLSAVVAEFPRYVSTPEIRVDCPEERKWEVVRAATEHFRARYPVVDVDGVRVRFADGWALVRASNTQPVLVLRCEARDEAALSRIRGEVEDWLRGRGVDL